MSCKFTMKNGDMPDSGGRSCTHYYYRDKVIRSKHTQQYAHFFHSIDSQDGDNLYKENKNNNIFSFSVCSLSAENLSTAHTPVLLHPIFSVICYFYHQYNHARLVSGRMALLTFFHHLTPSMDKHTHTPNCIKGITQTEQQ